MRRSICGLVLSVAVAGCGGPHTVSVSFTATPHLVQVHVGEQIAVQKSTGECGSPWSTDPRVISVHNPPHQGDCSPESVVFRAVGAGSAAIMGQLPCHLTECAAMGARIPALVKGKSAG